MNTHEQCARYLVVFVQLDLFVTKLLKGTPLKVMGGHFKNIIIRLALQKHYMIRMKVHIL